MSVAIPPTFAAKATDSANALAKRLTSLELAASDSSLLMMADCDEALLATLF